MKHLAPARLLATAVIALVALGHGGPAAALPPGGADPDTPGTSASASPTRVAPGDRLSFTVTGFPAGETVFVKIDDGTQCDAAAVHGACVYHQQKIPSSGTVSGSFTVPGDLAPGAHWLRFLASEPILRDGQQVGVKGYTARGRSDFTVVAGSGSNAGAATGSGGSSASKGSASGAAGGATGTAAGAGGSTAGATPGEVVKVAPPTTAKPSATATTAAPTEAPVAAAPTEQTATSTSDSGFPWIGALGLVGIVALSFVGTRLTLSRRG
ncbi:hypothetical protein [Aeromicrobium choanae]|uniref:Neocarzinostatin family protein n=1 Tax=Aeromicrobium choanae TaxID=1736691 RepID=A0A1T4Z728_9ACTN|nr:hypothetical protein [Aeromicrobium choanae]SKB09401.1 hypothetical protein SAMN06295964_2668 [Aeromicrobium choanae]